MKKNYQKKKKINNYDNLDLMNMDNIEVKQNLKEKKNFDDDFFSLLDNAEKRENQKKLEIDLI